MPRSGPEVADIFRRYGAVYRESLAPRYALHSVAS